MIVVLFLFLWIADLTYANVILQLMCCRVSLNIHNSTQKVALMFGSALNSKFTSCRMCEMSLPL